MPYSLKGRNVLVTGGSAYVVATAPSSRRIAEPPNYNMENAIANAATAGWASSSQ